MKTLLIFPPTSDPAHPPLGIASLAGYLREKGKNVETLDLNLLSYYHFLSRENLAQCKEKITHRLMKLETQDKLSPEDGEEYRLLAQNSMSATYLIDSIDKALDDLQRAATYTSLTHYKEAASIVKRAMEFVSAAHYPVRWYSRGFSMSYLPTKSDDVINAISDKKENLFISFYLEQLPLIEKLKPDIIGVSINYYCQLIPALTLASLLKKRLDRPYIVAGGGLICFFQDQWDVLHPFMENKNKIVDSFIPFEGEIPLFHLIETLEKGMPFSRVPGMVYCDGPTVYANQPPSPPDLLTLSPPDYEGLPLERYIAPEPVLLTLTSRGCYWGRCAFCSHSHLYQGKFRPRTAEQIFEEMELLSRRFQSTYFYFTDECVSPITVHKLACMIKKNRRPYKWLGEIRFEPSINAEMLKELGSGGCTMLMFGLESAEQRLLDLMIKGTRIETAAKILRWCKEANIRTFVMFFAGFPSETRLEAEKTVRFIEAHKDYISQVAFTNFVLEKRSPVYACPEKYGIEEIQSYPDEDLKIYAQYTPGSGLTAQEAVAFLDKVKDRPDIVPLIDSYLLSRSHLIFLPLQKEPEKVKQAETEETTDILQRWAQYPKIDSPVVSLRLAFKLDNLHDFLKAEMPPGSTEAAGTVPLIERSPGHYLFNPKTEKLVEVGEFGILLAKPCTGEYSLGDIISNIGEQNRQTAMNFYRELTESGLLYWESET